MDIRCEHYGMDCMYCLNGECINEEIQKRYEGTVSAITLYYGSIDKEHGKGTCPYYEMDISQWTDVKINNVSPSSYYEEDALMWVEYESAQQEIRGVLLIEESENRNDYIRFIENKLIENGKSMVDITKCSALLQKIVQGLYYSDSDKYFVETGELNNEELENLKGELLKIIPVKFQNTFEFDCKEVEIALYSDFQSVFNFWNE